VGLLDPRTHVGLLDKVGGCEPLVKACLETWSAWRAADAKARSLSEARARSAAESEELAERLAELDRLAPKAGEPAALAEERALLGAAEKTLADIALARDHLDGQGLSARLGQAFRALERARQRVETLAAGGGSGVLARLATACDAVDRAIVETAEASAAVDAAAEAFAFEPERLEAAETRLFALRAMARKLGLEPDDLPAARAEIASRLLGADDADAALAAAAREAATTREVYLSAAAALSAARRAAGDRLAAAVEAELVPLKLDKARFRVSVEPLAADRAGPGGADRVEFQVSTLPGAPFAGLGQIASGGELSRFALAIKASLANRAAGPQPLMIFDEVDQGVGGAVADAIGLRLRRLSAGAQVLVVTHSPQVAARADAHWRVRKAGEGEQVRAVVDPLPPGAREEEIARMLAGAEVTDAARAAARALMHA
jgi:DNA repair protein RecN (Recombination protein N)